MNIMKFIRSTYNYQTACMWQLQRLMHTISSISYNCQTACMRQLQRLMHTISSISYNCQTAYMQQLPMNTIKSICSI
ncbi:MAG: hypothetical protein SPG69_05185 [Bacteroides pyogenes]|uniref:hypothetical protein n=1 Tax=Bacteroides pyogenes TaxID=310300 RepID=UPI002A90E48D|nr:hypothetical protein [Bacteroides pyogenes]MDY5353410.1 hypothetical protein [Bacteroides pyogenes]